MDHSNTLATSAQALTAAQNYDVLLDHGAEFTPYLASMRAANPSLRIYAYVNGMYSDPTVSYDSSAYARDASGRTITMATGWVLMDPSSSIWESTILTRCQGVRATSHYDGCFLDNLGVSPFVAGYVTGLPINPATGRVWVPSSWLAVTSNLAESVAAQTTSSLVMANGVANGVRYFDSLTPTKPLVNATTSAMAESFLRGPTKSLTTFPSEPIWLKNVQMLSDAEASGGSVLATTKVWLPATNAQLAQWHTYAMASFLAGSSGQSYFNFSSSPDLNGLTSTTWQDQVDLGAPIAPVAKVAGVYQRPFAKGLVLVNPTPVAVDVLLDAVYKDHGGRQMSSLTLAANSAAILFSI